MNRKANLPPALDGVNGGVPKCQRCNYCNRPTTGVRMSLQELLSTADLAELLGVEEQTLRKRRKFGRPMPPGRRIGPTWVYCRADVDEWIRQQNRGTNGQDQSRPG